MENHLFDTSNSFEISPEFFSEEKKAPFTHCKLCNRELIENNADYVIEKAFSKNIRTGKNEIVYEFAYCFDCMEGIHGEISKESMQNLTQFFQSKSSLATRNSELTKHELFETPIWLNNCIITNNDIQDVSEYQITCLCKGNQMVFNHTPYMLSGEAMDMIVDLLSNETLDLLNGIWDKIIDIPDEMKDIFKHRPVFL